MSELRDDERAALAAWEVPEVPAGFAERVAGLAGTAVEAGGSGEASEGGSDGGGDGDAGLSVPDPNPVPGAVSGRGRGTGRGTGKATRRWGVVVVAAAAAFVLFQVRGAGGGDVTGSASAQAGRQTVALGRRGVAVLEPGAALGWTLSGSGAVIVQGAGDAFYRVDRGGPFRVETPHGEVRVTGTCFRVELIDMKKPWQALAGAAVGAAIVVTVYEGSVLFAGADGEEKAVKAGQVLTAGAEGGAAVHDGAGHELAGDGEPEELAAPARDLTREELLARDEVQRSQIAALRKRLLAMESGAAPGATRRREVRGADGRPWFDPGPDELKRFAEECRVRYDMPPLIGSEPFQLGPRMAKEAGLSPEETAGINRMLAELHRWYASQLRALYVEITGDEARADELSPDALASELRDKSPPGEAERTNRQISLERAGMATPPADLSKVSAVERFIRLQAGLGEHTEQKLAEIIGRDRARAMRENNGGWGIRHEVAGCPDGGGEEEVER